MDPPPQPWNSAITRIDFERCTFENIPKNAFAGLKLLTELRFNNNYIERFDTDSVSDLPNLSTLEIFDSDIIDINSQAFNNLPNLFELAIVRSNISVIHTNALHNLRVPGLPVSNDCPEIDIRINSPRDSRMMSDVMNRRLESAQNLPLPDVGARVHIYQSNISNIATGAFKTDLVSFFIFYDNKVKYLASKAFELMMSNQCEISAMMLVGNYFNSIQAGALAFSQGQQDASHATYFVMSNNTFEYVSQNGFLIHPLMEIFSIADNKFVCECSYFDWLSKTSANTRYENLLRDIEETSTCHTNTISVETFYDYCPKVEISTEYPMTMPDFIDMKTEVNPPESDSMSSASNIFTVDLKSLILCISVVFLLSFT